MYQYALVGASNHYIGLAQTETVCTNPADIVMPSRVDVSVLLL